MNSQRPRRLIDVVQAARRRKLFLAVPAFILGVATTIALREAPDLYRSTTRMRITSVRTDNASDLLSRLNVFRRQLERPETLELFTGANKVMTGSSEAPKSDITRIAVEPDLGNDSEPGAFAVSYLAADPEAARRVTDGLAARLVALNSQETSSAGSAAAVLRKQAADVSDKLRELEQQNPWLAGVRSEPSVIRPAMPAQSPQPSAETVRAQQMNIEGLKDQQYKIQQQLADVERRITAQRQIVDQQKKGSTLRNNPTYAVLIAKRTELQGQRDTLINRQELTDKHPRVLAINDQITAINRQIEELRQQDGAMVSQSPEARDLAALESERTRFKIDSEVTNRELARRSASAAVLAPPREFSPARRSAAAAKLVEQYLALKRNYQDATSELQSAEARLQRTDGSGLAELKVVEPASLPGRPVLPNRPLLISIASAVGLAVGAVFAGFAESRRFKSLHDARDVEYYTRLPLLAAIPKTPTVSERRRARWQATAWFAFATAASVAVTIALTRIFVAADIFALIVKK